MSFLTGTSTLQQLALNPPGSWEPVALGYLGNASQLVPSGVPTTGSPNTWSALQTFTGGMTLSGSTALTIPYVNANTAVFLGTNAFITPTAPNVLIQTPAGQNIALRPGAAADVTMPRIVGAGGTSPTLAAGANAGTGPPAPVLQAGSSDFRGFITFGTGTAPAAGGMVAVTFGTNFAAVPLAVIVIPTNAGTAALQPFVSFGSLATNGWTLSVGVAPAASQANTTYGFMFVVIG